MSADAWVDVAACPVCGRESCEDATHSPAPSTRFRCAAAVMADPPPVAIIEGTAWADCITVLVGESAVGKTFVLLDQAAAISEAADGVCATWHGRSVRGGSVAYISFEGDALGRRLRGLEAIGRRLDHVYVLRASDPLSPTTTRDGIESPSAGELAVADDLDGLVARLHSTDRPPIVLIVVDTVRASLTGSEDHSEAASAYIRAVRRLGARVHGAATELAHHAGWQDGDQGRKRERGSSAWRGNCDATHYIEAGEYDSDRGEAPLTIRALKVRDDERPAPLTLIRRRIDLHELDDHGRPVTTCVIVSDPQTAADRAAAQTAAAETEARTLDLRVLRVMRDQPTAATSQDSLRAALGTRKAAIVDSIARLIQRGWVQSGRRGQPYVVTTNGADMLIHEAES